VYSLNNPKIISNTMVFNIDNNKKYLLGSKSAYDWTNDADNFKIY